MKWMTIVWSGLMNLKATQPCMNETRFQFVEMTPHTRMRRMLWSAGCILSRNSNLLWLIILKHIQAMTSMEITIGSTYQGSFNHSLQRNHKNDDCIMNSIVSMVTQSSDINMFSLGITTTQSCPFIFCTRRKSRYTNVFWVRGKSLERQTSQNRLNWLNFLHTVKTKYICVQNCF